MMILNFRYSRPLRLGIADMQQQRLTINPIMIYQWSDFYREKKQQQICKHSYISKNYSFFFVFLFFLILLRLVVVCIEKKVLVVWSAQVGRGRQISLMGFSMIGLSHNASHTTKVPNASTEKDPPQPPNKCSKLIDNTHV